MTTLNTQLVKILNKVERPGTYCTRAQLEWHLPSIEVDGLGRLALPIMPQQAKQLTTIATLAPYGKGEETLVDTSVRNTWQIGAGQVHITGKHWQSMLDKMLAQVKAELGVTGHITASLYKLLVYGEGSFFIDHRDTEKAEGMFGSLIIGLPSDYQGGELCLKHAGQETLLDLRTEDTSEIAFAAFYADCVHEVLPVTKGYRVVLAYNLCIDMSSNARDKRPTPPDYKTEAQQIAGLLSDWTNTTDTEHGDIPLKLIYLLEHAYTPEGLAFSALKNGDAAIAGVMSQAAEQADCDCYLALISVEESGGAEYHGGYSRGRRRWEYDDDDESFEITEVFDCEQFISHWQQADGTVSELGRLSFEDEELCLPERLKTLEPDELVFQEATGNEGASFERTYRRAGIVVWPRQYAIDALVVNGVEMAVPYLASRVQQWIANGQAHNNIAWQAASKLAQDMIRNWPPASAPSWYPSRSASLLGDFLEPLILLRDKHTIELALRELAIGGKAYDNESNPALIRALALLPAETAVRLVSELIETRAVSHLSACAQLMREMIPVYAPDDRAAFHPAAAALLEHLPEDLALPTIFRTPVLPLHAGQVADLLVSISLVDEVLATQAIADMLLKRCAFPMDSVLIPAVSRLANAEDCPALAAKSLHQACLSYLNDEIAKPLDAPKDWAREANFNNRHDNEDCQALKQFLADPNRQSWDFAANENRRKALMSTATQANVDVNMTTIKRGSPHTLHFDKTDASYQRRVKQRALDERNQMLLQTLEYAVSDGLIVGIQCSAGTII